jgi:hypothetical protein
MQALPRRTRFVAGLLLALGAAIAQPAELPSLYTVEIVVFRGSGNAGALPDKTTVPAFSDDGIEAAPAPLGKLTNAATRLRSRGGMRVLAHKAWTQGPTAWGSGRGVSASQLALGDGVEGKISLERGENPLNVRLDLVLEEGGRRFRINEVRRNVKAGQVLYFDHPSFGVLAIVTAATATPAAGG